MRRTLLRIVLSLGVAFVASSGAAATLPSGIAEIVVAAGLANPTAMAMAPDGRIFVCEQAGTLRVIKNGALLSTPFLTVTPDTTRERGLDGIALDPDFANNGYVYISYTATTPAIHNRIARYTADGDVASSAGETVLVDLPNVTNAIHNGSALHFGKDGKLYASVGDDGTSSNAQSLDNPFGKLLRLNADGTIPNDNPFFNSTTGVNQAIWVYGLRNPFTVAVQPGTGRLFIDDVGESTWEEINDGIAGSNYGWPVCEGACVTPTPTPTVTPAPTFRDPLFQYGHGNTSTTGCAITGGTFYNPATMQLPDSYLGKYFFCDFCSGWIRMFNPDDATTAEFASGLSHPVDLVVGPDGDLYYLSRGNSTTTGQVGKIQLFTLSATQGTPQSAPLGSDFATALQVQALGVHGDPISGATVTFIAPASGASGTFAGSLTAKATTGANGFATAPVFTANGATGDYVVQARLGAANPVTSFNLTNVKKHADVTLENLSQTYNGTPKQVTVTTNPAGLNVTVTYNGSSTAPTEAGNYAVVALVNDPTYEGSANGMLVITPPPAPTPSPTATPAITPTPTVSPTSTPTATPTASATITPTVTLTPTATPSPTRPAEPAQLLNISARALIGPGDHVAIAGFIVRGDGLKRIALRGLGPSLTAGGVPLAGRLSDTALELHGDDGRLLASNSGWRTGPATDLILAEGLAPGDDRDSVLQAVLPPNSYTAVLGGNGSSGIGIVELYDLDSGSAAHVLNLSSRAFVSTGDDVLIDGIIVGAGASQRILFRAIGPDLQASGVADALADPTLDLRDENGNQIAFNDDWADAQADDIAATGVAPGDARDAAVLITLGGGNYTAVVRGKANGTGVALGEIYHLDNP